jgi:ABC-type transport system involved in multi-copper enzyme maturation permease subunit
MSAVAMDTTTGPMSLPRPGLGRLTVVELRKMTDTRSGFWLIAAILLLTLAAPILLMAVGNDADRSFSDAYSIAQMPCAVLLPVLGILAVTSEWTQRTALTTFALVTKRSRVVSAKLLAALALCVIAVVLSLGFAAIGTAVGTVAFDAQGGWSLPVSAIGEAFVLQAIGIIGGVAFGMVFLASAPAIVLYFVIPTAWGILAEVIPGLDGPAKWLDLGQTTSPLSDFDMSGTAWARLATSALLWVGVPLAIGLTRILRREVS